MQGYYYRMYGSYLDMLMVASDNTTTSCSFIYGSGKKEGNK